MTLAQSKLTAQGQISVPAAVRRKLGIGPGSTLDRAVQAKGIAMLLNNRDLTVQDADVVATAVDHFTASAAVSFSDCLVLEVARKAGHLPLGTFDRDLAKLPGAERPPGNGGRTRA